MRRHSFVVGAACALSLVALALFVKDHAYSLYDDAFIYLRYVKNVRAGCGLRFNCSESRVEGFSGPLWLFLLVTGSALTRKLVTLTQVLGTASMAALLVAAPIVAAQTHGERAANMGRRSAAAALIVAALLSFDHFALLNAVIGLEGGLAATITLLVFAAVSSERHRLAIALAFTLVLLRPEGVLFVLALFVFPWARTRNVAATCISGLIAIALARWLLFHDVVPNTVWAKSGGTARHIELGVGYLGRTLFDFPAVVLAPLALAWPAARGHARYLLVASSAWMLGVVFAGGDTFEYGRLLFPLVPALTVCGAQGALALAERMPRLTVTAARLNFASYGVGLLFGLVALRAAVAHTLAPSHGFENVARWTVTGQYLKAHFPGARIATVPIGAIAYFSELEVLDLVGLTSPTIAKAGRTVPVEMLVPNWIGHERNDIEYSLAWAPDLLITTKFRQAPWVALDEASAGFYADWLFLKAIKSGSAPYHVKDLEIAGGTHVLAFERDVGAAVP